MLKNKELTERVGLEMLKLEKQRQLFAEQKEIHRQSEIALQRALEERKVKAQDQKIAFQKLLEDAENQKALLREALKQPQSQMSLQDLVI